MSRTPDANKPNVPPVSAESAPLAQVPVRVLALGDAAWTVEFDRKATNDASAFALGFAHALSRRCGGADAVPDFAGVIEWVPSLASVTVHFDPSRADPVKLAVALLHLANERHVMNEAGAVWRIPVCFDAELGPDLEDVAKETGLGTDRVVSLLLETEYTCRMLGFMPGYAFLAGGPEQLDVPRLKRPRTAVPARSMAITGRMSAVYPWESPGGWRLMGRTPVRFFDVRRADRPALIAPGDRVRWSPINRAEFDRLEQEAVAGRLAMDSLLVSGDAGANGGAPPTVAPRGAARAESGRAESNRAESNRAESNRAESNRAEPGRAEDWADSTSDGAQLEVVDAGFAVTVQDRGRFGWRRFGVPLAGARDLRLLDAANALVGNGLAGSGVAGSGVAGNRAVGNGSGANGSARESPAADFAGFELTGGGVQWRVLGAPVRIAIAGRCRASRIDARGTRHEVDTTRSLTLYPWEQLRIDEVSAGVCYMAVSGGVRVPRVLSSRATYARAGLGGVDGRAIAERDRIAVGAVRDGAVDRGHPRGATWPALPDPSVVCAIRVMAGPQDDHFDAEGLAAFFAAEFRIAQDSDRMGIRLEGPTMNHNARGGEIASDGIVPGAIQVPPNGQPIVLMSDGQTTGGYPKIATVISADVPVLGQLQAGERLRFVRVQATEAVAAAAESRRSFEQWRDAIVSLPQEDGIDEDALTGAVLSAGFAAE